MIVETALRIAGPGSHLVRRPHRPVVHVYLGKLTRSGRHVPTSGRTVCRAHTRRLTVLPLPERRTSLDPARPWRLCVRCSARLSGLVTPQISSSRRAEPTTRDDYRRDYAHLTPFDLAAGLLVATTATEVDTCAHLSLALYGHPGCTTPVTAPDGRQFPSLHDLVYANRGRFTERSATDQRLDDLVATSYAHHIARRVERYQDREERIRRLGFNNATR